MTIIIDLYQRLFGKNHIQDGNVIDMAEHGRAGGVSTGQGFKYSNSVEQALKMTESGSITYIAKAALGSSQSSAVWQCQKIDETSGMVITWADSNANYDNVATDLTSLSYG